MNIIGWSFLNLLCSEALREAEGQNKDLSRSVQELISIRVQLTAERDSAVSELNDSRDQLRDLQARLDAATGSLNQLRSDFENRLREKDSELENLRYIFLMRLHVWYWNKDFCLFSSNCIKCMKNRMLEWLV